MCMSYIDGGGGEGEMMEFEVETHMDRHGKRSGISFFLGISGRKTD